MIDAVSFYAHCTLCPRRCKVDRQNESGFCGESDKLRIACASIHSGEEPPVTRIGGSGTIFISGCNLGCVFCQNYQISRNEPNASAMGRVVGADEFTAICLALEARGAENINIVTGSHAIPALAAGLDAARAGGLRIPALWNSSSYESVEALELLRGRIQCFLPDIKTLDTHLASQFFRAPDYPRVAAAAVLKMIALCETQAKNSAGGSRQEQVIIRHLILPDHLESTRQVLAWFAENARKKALLSLMTQYTPPPAGMENAAGAGIPRRFVSGAEYETVLGWLDEFGIESGFCQELVSGSDWLPDFKRTNPFSSELSQAVWHWKCGFV